jgi:hypothetical protein
LYAIVKPNDAPDMARHKGMPFVVVTLYTKAMLDDAHAHGRWAWAKGDSTSTHVRRPGKLDSKKTAQLVQKLTGFGSKLQVAMDLAKMKGEPIVPTAAAPPVTTRPTPPMPPTAPPAPAPTTPVADATASRMVTYFYAIRDRHPSNISVVEYQASELKQRLRELYEDKNIDHTTIRVWREVKAKVKVTVEYDIEE